MNLLFYCQGDNGQLLRALRQRLPEHAIYCWQTDTDIPKKDIEVAVTWLPPDDFFDDLPQLRYVLAVAAGVDQLLRHPGLPQSVPIVRLRDAGMAKQMAEYVLYGVLMAHRRFLAWSLSQQQAEWNRSIRASSSADTTVTILGAGALGSVVAERLRDNGYPVNCWSRTGRAAPHGITALSGTDALSTALAQTHVLVCLLPLTGQTLGVLNEALLKQLPEGAFLINAARGEHLVEDDLLGLIDDGHLSGALLDVFTEEPLPATHPFWSHPRIVVTPHVAAVSLVDESVEQLVQSVSAIQSGSLPQGLIDRESGY